MARQKYEVKLSDQDVQTIKNKLKKKDTTETIANRCRILMDVDRNHLPVMTQEKWAFRCLVWVAGGGVAKSPIKKAVSFKE